MVTLSFQDNSIIFTFENSSHYLQGYGIIEAPKGSLALVTDESNMATFVKASSNDIFVSATYEELGMTKAQLLETFAANAGSSSGGGGGLTPEEAQEMIDESISGKADTSAVTTELADKLDISDFNTYSASTDSTIASKADASDLSALSGVVDTKASDSDLQALESVVDGKLATSDFNTYSASVDTAIASKADTTAMTQALADKLDVSAFNTYSAATDSAIAAKASQADLDALENVVSGKADASALTNYVPKSEFNPYSSATQMALTEKVDITAFTAYSASVATDIQGKQDTLVSGTNIKTINNTSILGSGDIEISGGGDVDSNLDINSENAVANSAITKTIQDNELVIANALIDIQDDVDTVNGKVDSKADTTAMTQSLSVKASKSNLETVSAETNANTTALNGISLWRGRQERYDAITVKDPNTLYFIVDELPNYLRFTARNGAATIGMNGTATPNVSYSMDGETWTAWDFSNISLAEDETVYLKGTNTSGFSTSSSNYKMFTMSGTVEANGSVQSLLYGDSVFEDELTIPNNYCFYYLFQGCTGLTTAPQLPATAITNYCYKYMFNGCTSLTTAPELPAKTVRSGCYSGMFSSCRSLTNAPTILPATTLAGSCYEYMFNGCTSLTTAPQLPATTTSLYCYQYMFNGCTNLNYIKALFTTDDTTNTADWVSGVAASGTFVKNINATWTTTGASGVPSGWTIEYAE